MRLHVPDDAAGRRLDSFLADVPQVGSRAVAERLLGTGGVLVDGRVRLKSHGMRRLTSVTLVQRNGDIIVSRDATGHQGVRCIILWM